MANIKNIKVGSNDTYDIEALHFVAGNLDTPAQWKAYIDQIDELGFDIVVLTTLPTADATNYEAYHNKIVLVADSTSVTGSSVEYVIVRSGASGSYTYTWEKIGTTTADLTAYAKVGTKTSGPSTANTSSTDLGTKTTTAALTNSTGTVDISGIKYQKANGTTGAAGSTTTTKNTGGSGGVTINGSNFSFTGTDQSIAVTVTRTTDAAVGNHSYTPAGTVTVSHNAIKDVTLSASTTSTDGPQYVENVTHTAATLGGTTTFAKSGLASVSLSTATTTSTGAVKYVESVTHTAASLSGTKTFNTDAIKDVTLSASTTSSDGLAYVQSITLTAASLGGTKTFNTNAYKASVNGTTLELTAASTGTVTISGGSITPVTRYLKKTTTAASTGTVGINGGSIAPVTKYVKVATTAASTGTVTISGGSVNVTKKYMGHSTTAAALTPSFAGTAATITHSVTQPAFSGSFNNKNIDGTIGGSQSVANHTHTYLELQEHTHDISYTTTAVTGSASAAMVEHTHSVTLGSHSHTLNSHTHTQK